MDINKSLLLQNPRLYTGSTTGLLESANNLSDVDDATTARENLGVTDEIETQNGYTLQRRMVPRVISDGATTNRARILTPGAIGAVGGLPQSWELEIPRLAGVPSVSAYVGWMTSSATTFSANGLVINVLTTSGDLQIQQVGANSATDRRNFIMPSYVATYGANPARVLVVWPEGDSTTDPTIHINGVDKSSSFVLSYGSSGSGGAPNWIPPAMSTTYLLDGYNWPSGDAPTARVAIGAYSDADAVTWTAGGQRPAWAERPGDARVVVAPSLGYSFGATDANVTTGATNIANLSITAQAGARTGGAGSYYIQGASTGGNPLLGLEAASSWQVGQLVRVRFWISFTGLETGWSFYLQGNSAYSAPVAIIATTLWQQIDAYIPVGVAGNTLVITRSGGFAGNSVLVDDVIISAVGLIDNPIPQPGLTSFDSLARMSRRNVGHRNESDRDTFTIYANTSTGGNEQALGGALFESANNVTIDLIEQATATGTPTTTIGSASGGAQYKASGALSAGLNVFTPVTRKPASTSVWVGSGDTTNVRTIIHGHKVSVPTS